jgi:DNA polymerase III epsilon subunit-like protein
VNYLYLDTETTGLHDDSQVWNLAWILETNGQEVGRRDMLITHRDAPSVWVLKNTRYVERFTALDAYPVRLSSAMMILEGYVRVCPGDTYLVGAVPSFDDYRLRRIGAPPWHYHLIDVETLVMGHFGLRWPPSLREIAERTGVVNARPHDAMSDAQHVRDIHHWLLDEWSKR